MSGRFDLTGIAGLSQEQIQQGLEELEELKPDKIEDGASGEFTVESLWRTLSLQNDIIIIIDGVDEPRIRKQLSAMKAKENAKLKSCGIPSDQTTLEFVVHKDAKDVQDGQIKLQVYLKEKPKIKLHKVIVPKTSLA